MDIEYKGGNCVVITTKKISLVVDPQLEGLGLKNQGAKADVQLVTQDGFVAPGREDALIINGPGEYEVEDISIKGIAAQAHLDAKTELFKATIYSLSTAEVTVAIVGHIYPELSEEQLEAMGIIDVLIVPVGGNGYTLDSVGAIKVVKTINPKVVIPTHYADSATTFSVPQADLEAFTRDLGATIEESSKLKIKGGIVTEGLTVQVLTRTT